MLNTMMNQLLSAIRSDLPPEQVRAVVDRYLNSWRDGDTSGRAALFADNVVFEDPVGTPPIRGKAALHAFWRRNEAYLTHFTPTLESIVVCGNEAMVRFAMRIDVTGLASGSLRVLENFKLDEAGNIVELRAFWDANSLSQDHPAGVAYA